MWAVDVDPASLSSLFLHVANMLSDCLWPWDPHASLLHLTGRRVFFLFPWMFWSLGISWDLFAHILDHVLLRKLPGWPESLEDALVIVPSAPCSVLSGEEIWNYIWVALGILCKIPNEELLFCTFPTASLLLVRAVCSSSVSTLSKAELHLQCPTVGLSVPRHPSQSSKGHR